jgi:hypothetical protein
MATEVIAIGTTATDSASDIVVTAGTPVTVFLKKTGDGPVGSTVRAVVKIKSSGGTYHEVGALDGQRQAIVLDGPGTFRVSREETKEAFGVEKE